MAKRKPTPTPVTAAIIREMKERKFAPTVISSVPIGTRHISIPPVFAKTVAYDTGYYALRPELWLDTASGVLPIPAGSTFTVSTTLTLSNGRTLRKVPEMATDKEILEMTNEELAAYLGKKAVPNMDQYKPVLPDGLSEVNARELIPAIYTPSPINPTVKIEDIRVLIASYHAAKAVVAKKAVRKSRRSVGNIPAPHERPMVRNPLSCLR